jgi:hypothetical protein
MKHGTKGHKSDTKVTQKWHKSGIMTGTAGLTAILEYATDTDKTLRALLLPADTIFCTKQASLLVE